MTHWPPKRWSEPGVSVVVEIPAAAGIDAAPVPSPHPTSLKND